MEIKLSWEESLGEFVPCCCSDVVNKDGVSPLSCLLTDNGGQRVLDTLPWLDEGINRLILVKTSRADSVDWSRDAWAAKLTKEQVKIYSLYDEDCFEVLDFYSFETVLLAWRCFVKNKPKAGVIQKLII